MTAREIYEKETGNKRPSHQIALHDWQIGYNQWCENRVKLDSKEPTEDRSPRPLLIIGKEDSGKTFLAKNIAYGFSKPITLEGRSGSMRGPFMFSPVSKNTDLIIVDDVRPERLVQIAMSCTDVIRVDKPGMIPFEMKPPQVIITSNISEKDIDTSVKRRFEIIEVSIERHESYDPIFHKKRL
jgi:hypothetical protein